MGAKKILKRKAGPDLIIEVIDAQLRLAGSSKEALLKYLKNFGYKVFAFGKLGLIKYDSGSSVNNSLNLFFTKRKEIFDFVKK